ncbi:MAG: Gldg family protein, partial [bacterium]
ILDDINGTNRKIEITAFIKSNDERRFVIIALLDNYRHFAPGLNFKLVDYEIKKKLAIERGIDRSCILVESDGASQKAWEFDERNITSALLKLLHPDQKVIGTMIGHGEFNPQGSGGRSISQLVDYLEKENFVVKPIDISSSGTIPAEISLVIIVGPQRPFHEKDIAALKEFSSRGGSIALFLEPFSKHGLDNYLAELGLTDSQDMIIDKTENYFKEETTPVVKIYMDHPITAGFMAMQTAEGSYVEGIIMPTATSLKINSKASLDYTVQPLALTSEGSWGETNSQTMEYTPQKDNPGPLVVAAVGSRTYPSDEESESVTSHVLVVGDADFITDANLKEGSNFDFAINSLDWLAQKENLMGEHIKIAVDRRIDLEPAQMKAVQIVNFMLPMFIAGIGLFMWLKRR